MIPFGPWLPDQPAFKPEIASDVLNVIPHEGGYHPWRSWVKLVEATEEGQNPQTFQYVIAPNGIIANILGTENNLYKLNSAGNVWDDVSRAGGGYNSPAEGRWAFTQYNNLFFASNGVDLSQKVDLLSGTQFVDVAYPAGPPICKFLTTVRRFVVGANTSSNSNEVVWSGLAEPEKWAQDPVTLADSQILPTGGEITGLTGGEYGIVFQQHAIQRMSFSGPPLTFEFEKISTVLGLTASATIAQYGDIVFFLSTSGVKMIRGAQELEDIGEAKVDTWIYKNVDAVDLWRATGTIDVDHKLYLLSLPIDDSETLSDVILAYHWPTGEWSKIGFTNYLVSTMIPQSSYNVDTIDAIINNNIDTMDFSFDSPTLVETSNLRIAAFNADRELGNFYGDLMPATLVTGDIPLAQGKKTLLRAARPMFDGPVNGLRLTPLVHDRLQDTPAPKLTGPVNRNGLCPVRASGRYHRMKVNTDEGGSWEFGLGVDDVTASEMAP